MKKYIILFFLMNIISSCNKSKINEIKNFDFIISNKVTTTYNSKNGILEYDDFNNGEEKIILHKLNKEEKDLIGEYISNYDFFELKSNFEIKSSIIKISSGPPFNYSLEVIDYDRKIRRKIILSDHELENIKSLKNKKDAKKFIELYNKIFEMVIVKNL